MPTAIQEQDGSTSSRRILAFYFALLSGELLNVAAFRESKMALIAGGLAAVVTLLLLGYTTVQEIIAAIKAAKGAS